MEDPLAPHCLQERFGLSSREARVARLLAYGHTNDEIADMLSLSRHTVRNHTQRILRHLGVRSRAQVAAALLGLRPRNGRSAEK